MSQPADAPVPPRASGRSIPAFPRAGMAVGGYQIQEILGHGSMATVFRALDEAGHAVALKVFMETPSVSKHRLERFRREAEAAKTLRQHPNILTVYTTGQDGECHYIAMQPIEGSRTLGDFLSQEETSIDQILRMGTSIARALEYAHQRGVVHRDVKPSNILIDEFGQPLLTDFGVADLVDWPSFTATGAITGTPLYMSPEHAAGHAATALSDQYTLGVVLFEALTGCLPHRGSGSGAVKDVLKTVSREPARRPRLLNPSISPDLEAVLLKALEQRPNRRYPDCESFADDLERARTHRPIRVHRLGWSDLLRYSLHRYRVVLWSGAAGLLAVVASLSWYNARISRAEFDGLVARAQLRSANMADQSTGAPAPPPAVSRARQEIRLGRLAFARGEWEAASRHFQLAVNHASGSAHVRTMAHARLEQARAETLLGRFGLAQDLYRWVIQCPEASSVEAAMAQIEYLQNALLMESPADVRDAALLWRNLPEAGALRDALLCLTGRLAPGGVEARADQAPARLQNDLLAAAAIRQHVDGGSAAPLARKALDRSPRASDWPAPRLRQLLVTSSWQGES